MTDHTLSDDALSRRAFLRAASVGAAALGLGAGTAIAITVILISAALAAMGLDLVTALSSAATAVTNVGPGLGDIVGPAGNFAELPGAAKWLLAIAMLMGRLELLTVFVLFTRTYWRG